ncbi:hypothetical protein MIR68_005332 [Amoeboaphelidium protococcarum]|nr:hypothetical protein MIR68_005332 [Amoeboaphelidium protococcarum]
MKCILGDSPADQVVQAILDFIYAYLDYPNVEIEARFGVLIDRRTRQRLRLPIVNEAVLDDEMSQDIKFESNMQLDLHKQFNQLLNKRVTETQKAFTDSGDADADSGDKQDLRVKYKHLREIDEVYQIAGNNKVRVTKDKATGKVLKTIKKQKIDQMHIHVPYSQFDVRIAVATEDAAQLPENASSLRAESVRQKDRLSYVYGDVQVDLTQVTSDQGLLHELEMEMLNVDYLQSQKALRDKSEPNQLFSKVHTFYENIRSICAAAPN